MTMTKTMKYIFILLASLSTSWAQEATPSPPNPKQAAIEKIFSTLTPEELPKALEDARKAGVNQQILLEAHFLNLVDQENFKAIAQLTPKLLKQRDHFTPDSSEIFTVKEDWLSIIHYAQALEALEKNDKASFKAHITEAFWLSPRQGQAFAPHINKLRMQESMAAITLKPTHPLQPQDGSPATTLGELMKNKKGAVLHFWSPMSQEVHQNLNDFIQTSQACKKHNIAVISILVGASPLIVKDAELLRKEDASQAECSWITDPKTGPLSNTLRIMDIPTMVIISSEGKILFNGHPSKDDFWKQIKTLDSSFKRPENIDKPHEHKHADG